MAPISVEITGRTFIANKNEVRGIKYVASNLKIAYSGTEDGGCAVIALEKDYLKSIQTRDFNPESPDYDKETIIVNRGDKPIEKNVEFLSMSGKKKTTRIKISAI